MQNKNRNVGNEREVNKMYDKVKDYFEMEYRDTKYMLTHPYWDDETNRDKLVDKIIQRCLGVFLFIQNISDVPFDDIVNLYDYYKAKLEELR